MHANAAATGRKPNNRFFIIRLTSKSRGLSGRYRCRHPIRCSLGASVKINTRYKARSFESDGEMSHSLHVKCFWEKVYERQLLETISSRGQSSQVTRQCHRVAGHNGQPPGAYAAQ